MTVSLYMLFHSVKQLGHDLAILNCCLLAEVVTMLEGAVGFSEGAAKQKTSQLRFCASNIRRQTSMQ